jgi:hypothetical protein
MISNREKIVAELIANALSAAKREAPPHLLAEQHWARAQPLRLWIALLVGFRGFEKIGDWWRRRQQRSYPPTRQ